MPIANGVFKQLRYKRQTANSYGAPVAGGAGAISLPRVTSDLDITKETFQSNALRSDMQKADMRHGTRSVGGKINDELKVGAHEDFFESFCRQAWQVAPTTAALTTVTAAATTQNMGTFTRAAGSFLTDGFRLGDVGRWTGWAAPATANNGKNMMVIGLTATVMTVATLDGSPVVAKAAGDSVTFTLKGKKTWVPQTGHTNDLYTIEHFYSDLGESEIFDSCRIAGMTVNLPSTGMATIDIEVKGRNMTTQAGAYFTSPTPVPAGSALAAVNGVMVIDGTPSAILTDLTINGTGNATTGTVIGSNVSPDVFMGSVEVTGQVTAYFASTALRDLFLNETEASITAAFTSDNTAGSEFLAFTLPRIKATSANRDDGDKGLVVTMAFTALLNTALANAVQSTLAIQDSTVV